MAKRCGTKNGNSVCRKPRANWWKASMGIDWYGSSGGGESVDPFADIWGWWRADDFSGVTPNVVLNDKSGNGRTMTQAAGTLTAGTAANGQARFTGNATARLTSAATIESWPITVITVGLRADSATVGFFGHTGATGFNTLWTGYESTNRYFTYNSNTQNNTTTEAGADACYVTRIGWGSRVRMVNGTIQADNTLASIARSAAITVTIGTEYRGLNMAWQETLVWNRTLTMLELDFIYSTYINVRYSMSVPLWSSLTPVDAAWLAGQSNSAGRGDRGASDVNIPAEYDQALTGANIWNGSAWATLNINDNNQMLGDTQAATYIGHETSFGKEYVDRTGRDIYIMKYALGGSYLNFHNSTSPFWDPINATLAQGSSFRLYALAMREWWESLVAHQAAGRRPDIKGGLWFQGEQDASVEAYANAYSSNLQTFFVEQRQEMGIPMPVLKIMRIHINGSETYESTVRSQQALAAAAISGATLIDTDSYGTRVGDGIHLSVTGQLDLGVYLSTIV